MESFNLRYYPIYRSLVSMMAWLPVFFLYFNSHLEIKDVIVLESIYYVSVVVLEVPSGYFSDYFGRRLTLILSTLFFAIAYAIFGFVDPDFGLFVIAQLFLAGGMSFMSGTNTSFYYESLQAEGLDSTFADREAHVQSLQQYAGGVAVLLGGILGAWHLNLGYVVSLICVLPALVICLKFKEPGPEVDHLESAEKDVINVVRYLKFPELRWIFIFSIILFILTHIPYEFYQPYLELLDLKQFSLNTAIVSGVLFASGRFLGAMTAARSARWVRLYGLKRICLIALGLQLSLITVLGLFLHPVIAGLLLIRGISMALTTAPLNAEIAPRIAKSRRASYFSMQSLAGRLAYASCLYLLSIPVVDGVLNDWPTVSMIFLASAGLGLILSFFLLFVKSGNLFVKNATNS
ncbi:MAG: MFS transporter [Saprospiraceae bacterium]|nr:MFS transporter [Saprospiraceae bacterium]